MADSKISFVDGAAGRLFYRGYVVKDLAEQSTFEEVSYLLLFDRFPSAGELKTFDAQLKDARTLPGEILEALKRLPRHTSPMDVVQAGFSLMAASDAELATETREANINKSIRATSWCATIVAAWDRIRHGQEPVPPKRELSHAGNFLYMLTNIDPHPDTARDLDVCLILHAEHSFNASTFTARVVASTRAHMYAALSAAVGSLSGELHGGANAQVMNTLLAIGSVEQVPQWVRGQLDRHQKVMGMGHAVYKAYDPRAKILKEMSDRLGRRTGNSKWFQMTSLLEDTSREEFQKRGHPELYPNVDLYSASAYYSMGIAVDLFTPVFAIARTPGWAAHVIEEKLGEAQPKPALYRPNAQYTGRWCGPEGCPVPGQAERGAGNVKTSTSSPAV